MVLDAVVQKLALVHLAGLLVVLGTAAALVRALIQSLDVALVLHQLRLHVMVALQALLILGLQVFHLGDLALILNLLEVVNHLDLALQLLNSEVLDVLGLLGSVHLKALEDVVGRILDDLLLGDA